MSEAASVVELGALGLDGGAHVLVRLGLDALAPGEAVAVRGSHPELAHQLQTWCRVQGHHWRPVAGATPPGVVGEIARGTTDGARWVGAERGGHADPAEPGAVAEMARASWGLAARGAAVEPGGPEPSFALHTRAAVWTDRASALYRLAAAAQWDPDTAVDWGAPVILPAPVERAVVQVMTFLVENEEAALVVPARFLGQVHPHYREIQQVLATIVADEARHIEVFSRRAMLTGAMPALSTAGGRASLQTLLDETDYATASFLLSAMGEGTFLALLSFLERHAPDPTTRRVAQLARNDEARHVAFAMAHLETHVLEDASLPGRLARAAERRHHDLRSTAGLNDEVFDALVLLAAGTATPEGIASGWARVQALQLDMHDGRRGRLDRLGFTDAEAEAIAALHTRNFM